MRNKLLPEVQAGKHKSHGFSDLALADRVSMGLPQKKDLMFAYTYALVELKTGKAGLKQGQQHSRRFPTGVVVLGTNCAEKWRLVFFSKFNGISVQPFKFGDRCLQELKQLLSKSAAKRKVLVPPPPMQNIPEGNDFDPTGEEQEDYQEYLPGANLRKLALDQGKLYPDERESLEADWSRDLFDDLHVTFPISKITFPFNARVA